MDIREDIRRCQDTLSYASSKVDYTHTLSYASSKVDYSVGQNIYMLLSDMNLKIKSGTVGHNNKILVSDGKFSLGKNEMVNAPLRREAQGPRVRGPAMKSHKVSQTTDLGKTATTHRDLEQKPNTTHEEEKIAFVLFLAGGFAIWNMFQ